MQQDQPIVKLCRMTSVNDPSAGARSLCPNAEKGSLTPDGASCPGILYSIPGKSERSPSLYSCSQLQGILVTVGMLLPGLSPGPCGSGTQLPRRQGICARSSVSIQTRDA